ncbi:MAG: Na(+)/H(+) antiporter subunit F1 [Dehalobacterium sp.]|jgi:multicomponent Na+:H+ antiporter subunit F
MLKTILTISLIFISIAIAMALFRVIKGPTTPDRVMALDAIGIYLIALVAILSVSLNTHAFFDVMLQLGVLSFIGTAAYSRYLERGYIIERDHDR